MDVSVRAPQQTGRAAPVLRVIETERLVLHEDVDDARVDRLSQALRRDGVLRNPPIAAALPDGRAMVLDGANRVTALAALEVPHVVVQLVDYARADITLGTWRHYVRDPFLLDKAAALPRSRVVPGAWDGDGDGDPHLAAGQAVLVIDRTASVVVGTGAALPEVAVLLRGLVALYRERADFYRVDGGDLAVLAAEYGPGSLVVFPQFTKDAVLRLAAGAERLPSGVTRHLIQGRALRLNTPLAWLAAQDAAASKQAQLDALLQRRYLDHGVRYYSESTFSFDE